MTDRDRACRCWITKQPDLGEGVVAAANPAKARYATALSAHDAGYLRRANPAEISCIRAKEFDCHPRLIGGRFFRTDIL